MAFKKESGPPVRFGKPEDRPVGDAKSGMFLSVPNDKTVELKVLVNGKDIPSIDQCALWSFFNPSPVWTYIGEDDPSNDLGVKRGYRAFVQVSYKDDRGEQKVKLWSIPIGVHKQLSELEEVLGGLKGQVLRVKKSGSGLKTKYTVVSTGKRYKITEKVLSQEEVLDLLGPFTRDEIIDVIEERCKMSFDEVVAYVTSKDEGKPTKKKPKKFEVVEIEDEEFDEDEEGVDVIIDDSFQEDEESEIEEEERRPAPPSKSKATPVKPSKVAPTTPSKKAAPPKAPVIDTEEGDGDDDDVDISDLTDEDWDAEEGDIV